MGGGEKKHLSYALAFRKMGFNVLMVTGKGSELQKKCMEHGLSFFEIDLNGRSIFSKKKVQLLQEFFTSHRVDAVFFNGSNDVKAGGKAAYLAEVSQRIYWRGIAVEPKSSRINRKVFSTYLTAVVTNSKATKNKILNSLGDSIDESKMKVVYNGIDFEEYDAQLSKVNSEDSNRIIIGNAARLTPQKNLGVLIRLALYLKEKGVDFEIRIAGDGDQRDELEKKISKAGLGDQIRLLGFVDNVREFMEGIDLLAFPSLWEGFGFTLVEAMAAAKPVVAFNLSSNPEIVGEGCGFLVEEEVEFHNAVLDLCSDSAKRKELGNKARKYARETFSLSQSARQLASLLN